MNDLPKSFFLLLAFVALALALVVFFATKRILFLKNKSKGEQALLCGDYWEAIRLLSKAERVWDFNPNKHSRKSHSKDLVVLEAVLNGLQRAVKAVGATLAFDEYRDALKALQTEFSDLTGERTLDEKRYASVFMKFTVAQSLFRKQLGKLELPHKG